jgi:fatty acid desaturase
MFFWTGISIAYYHYQRNRMDEFRRIVFGMLSYYLLIALVMYFNFWFGFAYMLLPHLSAIIFLAVINYTWHAWTDSSDPKNIYKNSITVLNGEYNVYNEDYHVEHHKRPQTHWEEYPLNYEKHLKEYAENRAIIFKDTQAFVIFFWLMFGAYDKMADHMLDLNRDMTTEDKIKLLKQRLRPGH